MQAYLVKVARSDEAVGLFVAESLKSLTYLVDAVCDPGECVYRVMGEGGIEFGSAAPRLPWPPREAAHDEDFPRLFDWAQWNEYWQAGLRAETGWRIIPYDIIELIGENNRAGRRKVCAP